MRDVHEYAVGEAEREETHCRTGASAEKQL